MADLQAFIQENKKERERLLDFMSGLKDGDFTQRMPNGWTVAVTLAHLAFWDFRQATALNRYLTEGRLIGSLDALAVNNPLSLLSEAISGPMVVKFTKAAAEMADGMVEKLTQAQADELLGLGLERNLRRSLHRRDHLDKIEKALKN